MAASLPATAQEAEPQPMSAEAFDAYTLGRTLSYSVQGTAYGVEQYLPDRRVRWTFIGDQCQDGVWYERNGNICFLYDNAPTNEQCWTFYQTDTGLRAVFQGPDGASTELYEVEQSTAPMACMGPGVGV
ncbi:MAG: hypothetical protein KDK01_04045 [Rhodobacteraceae bacterium]|nr:hypothetical protein [Paracoccaceae bacterium]